MEHFDSIIIGFGKAGKTLASDFASQGEKVALIEKSAMMYGGTCINVACIPTKSLVKSAELPVEKLKVDRETYYQQSIMEKDNLTAMLRKKNFDKLNNDPFVSVYTGMASFVSKDVVSVALDNQTIELQGNKIFINTGSSPIIPDIEGLKKSRFVYDSAQLMDVKELPKRLAIIGGGRIGLEFASIYAGFGSRVTVFNHSRQLLSSEDSDVVSEITKVLEAQGIEILANAVVKSLFDVENATELTYEIKDFMQELTREFDGVLIAVGRRPNITGLNVEAAGIAVSERGAIIVNENLQTNVDTIWALGDVTGGPQFTYISLDDYRIVKSQLTDRRYNLKTRKNVPTSLFIEPPYSRVGLNEKEALAKGLSIKVKTMPAGAIPKAQVLQQPQGYLKSIVDAKTDKILGAMLFCAQSHEIINTVKLAMDHGLPYTILRDQVFTHPTMTEALNDLFNL